MPPSKFVAFGWNLIFFFLFRSCRTGLRAPALQQQSRTAWTQYILSSIACRLICRREQLKSGLSAHDPELRATHAELDSSPGFLQELQIVEAHCSPAALVRICSEVLEPFHMISGYWDAFWHRLGRPGCLALRW